MYEAAEIVRSLSRKCENANSFERSFRYDTLGSGCSTIFSALITYSYSMRKSFAFICKLIAIR